jgi:ADP-heptose:LPS heptosyltransferase
VPRRFLEPLATIADVHLFSLQPGADLTDTPIMDLSSPSIETLAARMAALDVVLTVDTMAAHLAGALGLRVWTLLHSDPDWRWGNTHRCAWYPTMRLFRQSIAGDWSAPVLEAADALREPSVRPRT